jgi:lysophospholipase L1-like esterase
MIGRLRTLAAIGDSITHNVTLSVPTELFWPAVLAGLLTTAGARMRGRNFGHNGNTSTQMLARMAAMTRHEIPTLGAIMASVNDPGNSIAGATTQANIVSMATTLLTAGTQYIVVLDTQFLNYSTGGDSIVLPSPTYATLRSFQLAAANQLIAAYPGRVAYCGVYQYMNDLIVAGTVVAHSFSWHVADSNQHLNALGEGYVAAAAMATIQAQPGWIAALQS